MSKPHPPVAPSVLAFYLVVVSAAAGGLSHYAHRLRSEVEVAGAVSSCTEHVGYDQDGREWISADVSYQYTVGGVTLAGEETSLPTRCNDFPVRSPVRVWVSPDEPNEAHLGGWRLIKVLENFSLLVFLALVLGTDGRLRPRVNAALRALAANCSWPHVNAVLAWWLRERGPSLRVLGAGMVCVLPLVPTCDMAALYAVAVAVAVLAEFATAWAIADVVAVSTVTASGGGPYRTLVHRGESDLAVTLGSFAPLSLVGAAVACLVVAAVHASGHGPASAASLAPAACAVVLAAGRWAHEAWRPG